MFFAFVAGLVKSEVSGHFSGQAPKTVGMDGQTAATFFNLLFLLMRSFYYFPLLKGVGYIAFRRVFRNRHVRMNGCNEAWHVI